MRNSPNPPLFDTTEEDAISQELFQIFDEEIKLLNFTIIEEEIKCASQIESDLFKIFKWTAEFFDEQKRILTYYWPFKDLIKTNLDLASRCFSVLLSHPVTLMASAPKINVINEKELMPLGHWQLDYNADLGGEARSPLTCYEVVIGPLKEEDVPRFLPGESQRQFIELGLCPLFLPDHADFTIKLFMQTEEFVLKTEKRSSFLGINTKLA